VKVKECGEYGRLEYKLPNIPEAMRLLGAIGLNSKKLQNKNEMAQNELLYISKIIENLGTFISKIDITIGEVKVTKYDDLLNHFCVIEYLSELAGEIFSAMSMDTGKK
jgi:alanine dehydrogenase